MVFLDAAYQFSLILTQLPDISYDASSSIISASFDSFLKALHSYRMSYYNIITFSSRIFVLNRYADDVSMVLAVNLEQGLMSRNS